MENISQAERIKRAEEIYYRRRMNNLDSIPIDSSKVKYKSEKRQYSLYKKLAIKILICILIYLIFSLIKEADYIFSESVMNKTKECLSNDINFIEVRNKVNNFFEEHKEQMLFITNLFNKEKNKGDNEKNENKENNEVSNKEKENINGNKTENTQISKEQNEKQIGIGGAEVEKGVVFEENNKNKDTKNKTQMEIDAKYISDTFKMVLPVKGKITSPYGKRTPTKIISENHQGVDIGVEEGTKIVSAMEGTVSVVSDKGEYGKHIKIVNKDITTIYAHCSKIIAKEGEKVKCGQLVALSGNTGKTTGPHLHFEIRRESRTIDPELILNWK